MFEGLAWRNTLLLALVVALSMTSTHANDFFPDVDGNLTKITWAHAVNNHSYLVATLANDDIMMIEADVVLGLVDGTGQVIPIMAHPPENKSDLSLQSFFFEVVEFNNNPNNTNKKGVKLDFKTIDAFLASVYLIQTYDKYTFPIWINADIIPGPINATTTPVDADEFLTGSKPFSNSTLSIGWTTLYGSNYSGSYEADQIQKMIDAITRNNVTQSITFPVRAGLAAESVELLVNLLKEVENSTLTIWSSEGDNVNVENLRKLIAKIGISKVYVDVPSDFLEQLHLDNLPNSSAKLSSSILSVALLILLGLVNYWKL